MGDMAEVFRGMRDDRKERRRIYGVACPRCSEVRPKADPSILLPGQRCKVDGYRDPRGKCKGCRCPIPSGASYCSDCYF